MKRCKIPAILLSALCIFSCASATACASEQTPVIEEVVDSPYLIATNPISLLNFMGNTAYCTSQVAGKNATMVSILQVLQKYEGSSGYTDVSGANWIQTHFRDSMTFCNTATGLSSGKYRLKSVFTLRDKNGKQETFTIYSSEMSVS